MRSDARNNIAPPGGGDIPTCVPAQDAAEKMDGAIYGVTIEDAYELVRDVTREVAVERGLR